MATPAPKKSTLVPNQTYSKPATRAQLERTAARLRDHGMNALIVPDRAAALKTVLSLLPERSDVLVSTSETLIQIGLAKEVEESGRYESIRKRMFALDRKAQEREFRQMSQAPQIDVGSAHAVTEEGDLLFGSATGSQLGPYSFGAGKVIWVVGAEGSADPTRRSEAPTRVRTPDGRRAGVGGLWGEQWPEQDPRHFARAPPGTRDRDPSRGSSRILTSEVQRSLQLIVRPAPL
jgi:hypothetical protein